MTGRALAGIILVLVGVAGAAGWLWHGHSAAVAEELWRDAKLEPRAFPPHQGVVRSGVLLGESWQTSRRRVEMSPTQTRLREQDADREVIETLTDVWHLDHDAKTATRTPRTQPGSAEGRGRYRFRRGPRRTVAGRDTREVSVIDGRTGERAQRVFVDEATGGPLRTEQYDADGYLAAWSEYQSFTLGGATTGEAELPPSGWDVVTIQDDVSEGPLPREAVARAAGVVPLEPAVVPEGYEGPAFYSYHCAGGRTFAELRYRDMLRTWSLYERPAGQGRGRGRGGGSGWGRGRGVRWPDEPHVTDRGVYKTARVRRGDLHVAFSGDLTDAEIKCILESIPGDKLEYVETPSVLQERDRPQNKEDESHDEDHSGQAVDGHQHPGPGRGPGMGAGARQGQGQGRGRGAGMGRGRGRGSGADGQLGPGLDPVGEAPK